MAEPDPNYLAEFQALKTKVADLEKQFSAIGARLEAAITRLDKICKLWGVK
jgi:hypothetical protein